MIKLYKIPRQSKIYCDCNDGSKFIIFHHIDGLYSFCKTEKGNTCHLGAFQQLEEISDKVYKLKEGDDNE